MSTRLGRFSWRLTFLILFALGILAAFYSRPVILQDQAYHAFADTRSWLGIPNFADVASNLPFLVFGLMGIRLLRHRRNHWIASLRSWQVFFVGVALVAPGSAYYHWNPSDGPLVWDRLPMTIGFMGVLSALISEFIDRRLEKLLPVFILTGFASVAYWHFSGDLRFYLWVQIAPILCIPLVLLMFPSRYGGRSGLMLAFAAYAAAKLAELQDAPILAATGGWMSGHTLKHLLASLAPLFIWNMLRNRLRRRRFA